MRGVAPGKVFWSRRQRCYDPIRGGGIEMAEGFTIREHAETLAGFLARHPKALVLTGAGLSTASGIPDYRDRDGERRGKMPIQGPEFRRSAAVQRRYWARSMVG